MKNKVLLMSIAVLGFTLTSVAQVSVKGTFTDSRDGKMYNTIKIGMQIWLAENLSWKTGNGCFAYDNNENNAKIYGYLYNWETVAKACPAGWHLPSEKDWASLNAYLGGDSLAHNKLKEPGTAHWKDDDSLVTNDSKFTALPGGLYSNDLFNKKIKFQYLGHYGYWWSASTEPGENNYLNACFRTLGDYYKNETLDYASKSRGSSVRCIKD